MAARRKKRRANVVTKEKARKGVPGEMMLSNERTQARVSPVEKVRAIRDR